MRSTLFGLLAAVLALSSIGCSGITWAAGPYAAYGGTDGSQDDHRYWQVGFGMTFTNGGHANPPVAPSINHNQVRVVNQVSQSQTQSQGQSQQNGNGQGGGNGDDDDGGKKGQGHSQHGNGQGNGHQHHDDD